MAGTATEPASSRGRRPGRDTVSAPDVVPGAVKSPTAASPLTAYLFLAPYLVLFGLFVLAPILYGLWISLHDWDFLLPGKPFVGLRELRRPVHARHDDLPARSGRRCGPPPSSRS